MRHRNLPVSKGTLLGTRVALSIFCPEPNKFKAEPSLWKNSQLSLHRGIDLFRGWAKKANYQQNSLRRGWQKPTSVRKYRPFLKKLIVNQVVTLAYLLEDPLKGNALKQLTGEEVTALLPDADLALAVQSNLAVLQCLAEQIGQIERVVTNRVKLKAEFQSLLPVRGIGQP